MIWKRLLALAAAALLGAACMFGWFYRLELRKYDAYQRHMAQQPKTYPLAVFGPEEFHRLRLTDAEGREATIPRADNRLAVVSFWASWCAPCIAEFEGFQKLRERAPANVDFYFVTDDPIASVEAMAGRFELPFYTYGSDSALPA